MRDEDAGMGWNGDGDGEGEGDGDFWDENVLYLLDTFFMRGGERGETLNEEVVH